MKEYIQLGLEKEIVDPGGGANIDRKLARLQSACDDLESHPNLREAPPPPQEGWDSCLADLPNVTFASLYKHFMERPLKSLLGDDPVGASSVSSTSEEDATDDPATSFRGVEKGYRFFKSGHVQRIEFHRLPASSEFCYVRAKVLPSMVKNKVYCVHICLTSDGHIHTAYCVCPAGLAGCCNHVAALIYALEEFVRLGLREESRLPCTSKLQRWNKPRQRHVAPSRVISVFVEKEEFGKRKRRRTDRRMYDPRPMNLRFPDPAEHRQLLDELQAEHDKQAAADCTGNVSKYGSTCLRNALLPTSSEKSSSADDDEVPCSSEGSGSNSDTESLEPPLSTPVTGVEDFLSKHVSVTAEEAAEIEAQTRGQSATNMWFSERRKRITATLVKSVACRRKPDFSPIVVRKLSGGRFRGSVATRYGLEKEGVALQDLKLEIEGNLGEPVEVRSSGLVVNVDKPWLSATPDGVLSTSDNTFLVEIKCPYTARDLTIAEAVVQLKSFCLEERDGVFKLKRNHTYFYQIQAQMYVSNIDACIFIVWTQREMFKEIIELDAQFMNLVVPKLEKFYFDHFLPALTAEQL